MPYVLYNAMVHLMGAGWRALQGLTTTAKQGVIPNPYLTTETLPCTTAAAITGTTARPVGTIIQSMLWNACDMAAMPRFPTDSS
jgi:hypothetical protein